MRSSVWVFRREWDGRSLAILIPSSLVGIVLGYVLARARFRRLPWSWRSA